MLESHSASGFVSVTIRPLTVSSAASPSDTYAMSVTNSASSPSSISSTVIAGAYSVQVNLAIGALPGLRVTATNLGTISVSRR